MVCSYMAFDYIASANRGSFQVLHLAPCPYPSIFLALSSNYGSSSRLGSRSRCHLCSTSRCWLMLEKQFAGETASANGSSSKDAFLLISTSSKSEAVETDPATSHCASESQCCCCESESEDGPRKVLTKTKTSRKG